MRTITPTQLNSLWSQLDLGVFNEDYGKKVCAALNKHFFEEFDWKAFVVELETLTNEQLTQRLSVMARLTSLRFEAVSA